MPWNYRDYIQLGLLICCVPLQFYLSNLNDTSGTPKQDVLELVNDLRYIKQTWFTSKSWRNAWTNVLSWFVINILGVEQNVVDESPAVEVLEYRKKHGLRTKTSRVRDTRPQELWFRIGQVVEHVYGGYRGVIVEWEFDPKKSSMPVYRILLDESSVDESEIAGIIDVEQDQLYLLKNTEIVNRFLKNYFSAYDGTQYIPQPWLQQLYPRD